MLEVFGIFARTDKKGKDIKATAAATLEYTSAGLYNPRRSHVVRARGGECRKVENMSSIESGSPGAGLRGEFPIFAAHGGKRPLAYLDTAASSQKPRCVIDRLARYLSQEHANIHRGPPMVHPWSLRRLMPKE